MTAFEAAAADMDAPSPPRAGAKERRDLWLLLAFGVAFAALAFAFLAALLLLKIQT
jgi:hypothetical protein